MKIQKSRAGRILTGVAAAVVIVAPALVTAQPADAAKPKTLTTAVITPFNISVGWHRILVADGFASRVAQVRSDGSLKTIANGPTGGDVAGVAIGLHGRSIAWTSTEHPDPTAPFLNANGSLHVRRVGHKTKTVNLAKFEAASNPDKKVTYGAVGTISDCAREALEEATGLPATYTGVPDAHPYAVARYKDSSWLVADAGGNALLKVSRTGKVKTVAVFPAQPLTITPAMAAEAQLPDCVAGVTYRFEAVPTDVEVSKTGMLYVSILSGGPESPAFGARSKVYRVNPKNGHLKRVASGLAGATNLARRDGKTYVAELFAGRVSVIRDGKPVPYVTLPGVVSVERGRGELYAGTMASDTEPGTVVRLRGKNVTTVASTAK